MSIELEQRQTGMAVVGTKHLGKGEIPHLSSRVLVLRFASRASAAHAAKTASGPTCGSALSWASAFSASAVASALKSGSVPRRPWEQSDAGTGRVSA